MKNKWIFLFATMGLLSYDQFVEQCQKGTSKVPIVLTSTPIRSRGVNPRSLKSGGTSWRSPLTTPIKNEKSSAVAEIHCWKEGRERFAVSDLLIDGKKVYSTPPVALKNPCGSAAGEIFRPFQWAPDAQYLAWIFIPYCWETEPIQPVVMFYNVKEKKSFAPKFNAIGKEFFKRYPKAEAFKKEIEFVTYPVQWVSNDKLLLEMGVICYGCTDRKSQEAFSFPITQWTISVNEKIAFVGEKN